MMKLHAQLAELPSRYLPVHSESVIPVHDAVFSSGFFIPQHNDKCKTPLLFLPEQGTNYEIVESQSNSPRRRGGGYCSPLSVDSVTLFAWGYFISFMWCSIM